jgi:hypothetical protein
MFPGSIPLRPKIDESGYMAFKAADKPEKGLFESDLKSPFSIDWRTVMPQSSSCNASYPSSPVRTFTTFSTS